MSLESNGWLYATLYNALRPWSMPGAWAQRIAWMLGLSLLVPTHDRMEALLAENGGSFGALVSWLANPIRWAVGALTRRISRAGLPRFSTRVRSQVNDN
jgi:hypothetical protein